MAVKVDLILDLFPGPNYWRTPGGIARQIGLPLSEVESYLESHPEIFKVSPISPSGTRLYGLQPDVGRNNSVDP